MALERRNILTVFLASPSDLEEERRTSRTVVDDLNRMLKSLGWAIDLLGWEDRLPGYGRPQEQINEDVDRCDLFVGLLWRRWGMPTGSFESGFEEEIERARKRRRSSGEPEIWIYFKRVDPEQVNDPGEQLRKVLAFKEQLKGERELLYSEFRDPEEWRKNFYEGLFQYVLKLYDRERAEEVSEKEARGSTISSSGNIPLAPLSAENSVELVPLQLRNILSNLTARSLQVDVEQFQSRAKSLNRFEVTRLYLLAATWMSRFGTGEPLDNHTVNLSFLFREEMELTPWERVQLLRSMIKEGNRYVPGWYWFRDRRAEEVESFVQLMALNDPGENFRAAALQFLAANTAVQRIRISDDEIASQALSDQSEDVVRAALRYAVKFCTDTVIEQIESLKDHESWMLASEAEETIQAILARCRPDKALERIVQTPRQVSQKIFDQLHANRHALTESGLQAALQHSQAALRAFAARELSNQGILVEEQAHKLLEDPSALVRATGIRRLIQLRKPLTPEEIRNIMKEAESKETLRPLFGLSEEIVDSSELIRELFETYVYDDLVQKVEWFSLDGPIVYQVLSTRHFERWESQIREDLKDRFENFRKRDIQRLREIFREHAEAIVETFSRRDLLDFSIAQFAEAALCGLLEHGTPDDVELARPYLNSPLRRTQLVAVRLVAKAGGESDVEPLVAIAKNSYGNISDEAAKAALALSSDSWSLACRFLDEGDSALVNAAVTWLISQPSMQHWDTLERFLYEKNDNVRMGVAKIFSARLGIDDLKSLLDRYPSGASFYYYDVVAYFDRTLYAPKAWRPNSE